MALTFAASGSGVYSTGKGREVKGTLTFDSSYPTGGESYLASLFGLSNVDSIDFGEAASGYDFEHDKTNKKIKVYNSGGTASGTAIYSETGSDIKGSANTKQVGASSTTIPTNGNLVSTSAAANNTTAFTIAANPDLGRNVGVGIQNASGGTASGNAADYAIVGTWKGAAQTETISFSSGDLASVPNNALAYKYGSKPFDTITSITPSAAQPASWDHVAGIGSKVGLYNNLKTPAEADVLKITKNAAHLAVTGLVDTTNMTVNLGTLADNDDFQVKYQSLGVSTTGVSASEVANTTSLSSVAVEVTVSGV